MERKLRTLFDYQRFSPNRRLAGMIDDVERRYAGMGGLELSDDDLDFVAAAGNVHRPGEDEDDDGEEY